MSRVTLFAIPMFLFVACPAFAQQTPTKVSDTTSTDSSSTSTSVGAKPLSSMSPREAAEMRAHNLMAPKEHFQPAVANLHILLNEPKNAELLNKVGVAFQQLGDLDRSEKFYKRAMHADKTFASAANNCGTVEYEKKHYSKAISMY